MYLRKPKTRNYTTIHNSIIRDKALTWQAKGMLCYILSLPDNSIVSIDALISGAPDGHTCVSNTLNELEKAGYILRRKKNTFDGKNLSKEGKDMGRLVHECLVTETKGSFEDSEPDTGPVKPETCVTGLRVCEVLNTLGSEQELKDNIPSFIPPNLQLVVSSEEQAKADVVAHAPLTNEQPKPKAREDLPDLNNPRYAHHRRIAEDAFDRCGQTPSIYHIRQLMRTLSDCEDCWTLEDQERLLPKVIQAAFDRSKPIVSLSGFLRYSGRGGAANHPFGAALSAERPEPKPQAVLSTANRVSGWRGAMAVPEPLTFNREAWLEENRIARAKHLNTRHIARGVAMSPDDKEAHSSSIRRQAQRMLDAVNGETIP